MDHHRVVRGAVYGVGRDGDGSSLGGASSCVDNLPRQLLGSESKWKGIVGLIAS